MSLTMEIHAVCCHLGCVVEEEEEVQHSCYQAARTVKLKEGRSHTALYANSRMVAIFCLRFCAMGYFSGGFLVYSGVFEAGVGICAFCDTRLGAVGANLEWTVIVIA